MDTADIHCIMNCVSTRQRITPPCRLCSAIKPHVMLLLSPSTTCACSHIHSQKQPKNEMVIPMCNDTNKCVCDTVACETWRNPLQHTRCSVGTVMELYKEKSRQHQVHG